VTFEARNFEFTSLPPQPEEFTGAAMARVYQPFGGKLELLFALATQLSFPEYFGANWDALEESLQDLLPNHGRALVIVHEALPASLTDSELLSYLAVLDRVIKHRREFGEPMLRVVFANELRTRIESLERR